VSAGDLAVHSAPMTDQGEHVRVEPPLAGDEAATLVGSLERQRAFVAWKCGGLDQAGLSATLPPSTITLGGLLKHLAFVETYHFTRLWFGREDPGPPWNEADWEVDPDWEWHSAAENTPEELMTLWRDAVAWSRTIVAEALSHGGLDQLGQFTNPEAKNPEYRGKSPSLRRILIDLIEEYARHVGHADLIRESVDGVVGEDPPGW
jgi:Protein of unknown function (DUF664)